VHCLLRREAGSLVFEVGEGAAALGNEEKRFESGSKLVNVANEMQERRLRRQIANPNGVSCGNELLLALNEYDPSLSLT